MCDGDIMRDVDRPVLQHENLIATLLQLVVHGLPARSVDEAAVNQADWLLARRRPSDREHGRRMGSKRQDELKLAPTLNARHAISPARPTRREPSSAFVRLPRVFRQAADCTPRAWQ